MKLTVTSVRLWQMVFHSSIVLNSFVFVSFIYLQRVSYASTLKVLLLQVLLYLFISICLSVCLSFFFLLLLLLLLLNYFLMDISLNFCLKVKTCFISYNHQSELIYLTHSS